MVLGSYVIDLLGRKFQVGRWDFIPFSLSGIPKGYLSCYTRDRLTNISISLYYSPDKSHYIMQTYNNDLKVWVRYKVKFVKYIPKQDMRNIKV